MYARYSTKYANTLPSLVETLNKLDSRYKVLTILRTDEIYSAVIENLEPNKPKISKEEKDRFVKSLKLNKN